MDLEPIWKVIEPAAVTVLGTLLAALVTYAIKFARAHLTEVQWKFVLEVVRTAVAAAEQAGGSGAIKKDFAISMVTRTLASHNIKLAPQILSDVIEAAVWQYLKLSLPRANTKET